jgi:membrane complex biogenesis BtpA family protein
MAQVMERALTDAACLEDAGFDALLVENFLDAPFFGSEVPPEAVAAMARVVGEVVERAGVPVGVNVLRNDARAALGVAVASGADFIRVNVHTGTMWTDQGALDGRAAETLRVRTTLGAPVAILADVLVKHATPPPGLTVESAARDAWHRGLADALVVSGDATGHPTDPDRIRQVRAAVPDAPVLVGSGVTPDSVGPLLDEARGVIVGSAVARDGTAGSGVDPERARRFVEAVRE